MRFLVREYATHEGWGDEIIPFPHDTETEISELEYDGMEIIDIISFWDSEPALMKYIPCEPYRLGGLTHVIEKNSDWPSIA